MPLRADHAPPRTSILLAEDHLELRELLAQSLEADGAIVECVEDGVRALDKLLSERFRPDVLLSDVRMPRMTGLQVLEALRARGLTLPVILMTGFGESVHAARVEALGGAMLLEKPLDFEDLRAALRNLPSLARR